MDREVLRSIKESLHLYRESSEAGLDHGCLQISLQALGADSHIQDVLYTEFTDPALIFDFVERNRLQVGGVAEIKEPITGDIILSLLTDGNGMYFEGPRTKLNGFLGLELFDDEAGHAIAILPSDDLTRIARRELKKSASFMVIDSMLPGGMDYIHTDELAHLVNHTLNNGGRYMFFQIRRAA